VIPGTKMAPPVHTEHVGFVVTQRDGTTVDGKHNETCPFCGA
jgi:hypothetical protein